MGATQADIAREVGVTRARVCAVLRLLDLDPTVLRNAEAAPAAFDVRDLLAVARLPPSEQANALGERTKVPSGAP